MELVRRISALVLVATLLLVGIPLPAYAAEGESPPLTLNGRPLSQLLNRTASSGPFPLASLLGQETGQISGVALSEDGTPLAEHTVQLKRVSLLRRGRAEEIVGTATTNPYGGFAFTGLEPSEYLLEVIVANEVVASASTTLVADAMQVSGVAVSVPDSDSGGMGTLGWVLMGALGGTVLVLWAVTYRS